MRPHLLLAVTFTAIGAAACGGAAGDTSTVAASSPPAASGRGPGAGWGRRGGGGPHEGHPHLACSFGHDALSSEVLAGAREALADEHRAEAQYARFASRFGMPFPRLERAEQRHADLLAGLIVAHGHEAAPPPQALAAPPEPATAQEACTVALRAERANVALYDRLLAAGPPDDVRCVYAHLRSRSADRHIPALERCGRAGPRDPR